ncbi:helix-turn-helix domain-containing protein [Aeromicrobium sp.]|uniref:helix-turn-helix domain-containing protein n=1 Tax=Aeromicrobium sp. TaxID=1871063 RepID=UPI0019B47B27|nr:helix-turn-helix domain-containing protein [Aeromicrobium sp.]MBC7632903.1 GAF domain-containing protein [Aeromicrobium sp.]
MSRTAREPAGDSDALTRATHLTRDAVLAGRPPARAVRTVIGASWRRVRAQGLTPGGAPEISPLSNDELARRREISGTRPLMPLLRQHLIPACEATDQLMVVADVDGRVLWREGLTRVLHHADGLGFVGGSAWTESNVGTNAIGTCLIDEAPVHIHAAEHYAETHTPWTCAAAPLRDPLSGRVIGVVDVSGPVHTVHAGTLSLVTLAARLAELELRSAHDLRLHGLRSLAAPLLARLDGRAFVVNSAGMTAAATGFVPPDHIVMPVDFPGGDLWLPPYGLAFAEPLPGGWLLRLLHHGERPDDVTAMTLDVSGPTPALRLDAGGGSWAYEPSPRHCEIILALMSHPHGRTAAELADDLFGDHTRTVTVRAEVSRLRRVLGSAIVPRPYRILSGITVEIVAPADRATALPGSAAPAVARWRNDHR